jgi:hypothetical protein
MYSWTPPVVRDKILAVARAHLSAQGVAFISYNTLPAGQVRKMMREMMLYHIGGEMDPDARLKKARELLRVMAIGRPEPDALEKAVAARRRNCWRGPIAHCFTTTLARPTSRSIFTNSLRMRRGTV